jgi:hypothetical protein
MSVTNIMGTARSTERIQRELGKTLKMHCSKDLKEKKASNTDI